MNSLSVYSKGKSVEKVFLYNSTWDIFILVVLPLLVLSLCFWLAKWDVGWSLLALYAVIDQSHIIQTVFRTHGRGGFVHRYPFRLIPLPLILGAVVLVSDLGMLMMKAIVGLWGPYHVVAQTFGICRIYDRNFGNSPENGRRADFWLALFLILGPVILSTHAVRFIQVFSKYGSTDLTWLNVPSITFFGYERARIVIYLVLGLCVGAAYLSNYVKLKEKGYRHSPMKFPLILTSAIVALFSWCYLPFPLAIFAMNFQHSVQYHFIVWLSKTQGTPPASHFRTGVWMAAVGLVFGCVATQMASNRMIFALWNLVSLLHLWYDGFIWSVRRGEV